MLGFFGNVGTKLGISWDYVGNEEKWCFLVCFLLVFLRMFF